MFERPARVHFIGVGGAGMSAIAKVLLERGFEVSGSDLKPSRAATMLEAMGARVAIGHDPANVEHTDVVVVSTAIGDDNPELVAARAAGLEVVLRGRALAHLLAQQRSLVVAGTHGKTSTTSMIVTILAQTGLDPTYLVGAGLNDVGTNARAGLGDLTVAEADESDGSFLWLAPDVAVVTNVEMDHHDRWSDLDELRVAFGDFLSGGPEDGTLVVPADDSELLRLATGTGKRLITFGTGGDVSAGEISVSSEGVMSFTMTASGQRHEVALRVPGSHNVANALAAAAACLAVGVEPGTIAAGLRSYRGVERRFQVRGEVAGVTVIDDYAHHPTEIRATLAAARMGPWSRIVAVFQPHRYSRTEALWRDFGSAFADADRVVLMDVYPAGEEAVPGVTGKLISDAVCSQLPGRPVAYFPHRLEMLGYLSSISRPGDALLTLGAGDVTTVGDAILEQLGAGT